MRAALLVAALAAACGGRAPAVVPPASPPEPPIDRPGAAVEVAATVRESYRFLSHGYDNVYLDGLRADGHLLVFDIGPDEVFVGYDPRVVTARRVFGDEDDEAYELWSKDLSVVVAADISCAWTHDDLSHRVRHGARRAIVPLRATALYERVEGRWIKAMEHVSYAMPEADAAARAVPITAPFPVLEPEGEGLRVRELVLASLAGDGAAVARDAGALALGVSAARELRGADVADAPTVTALTGASAVEATAIRVEVSRSGTVAWAAALLQVADPSGRYAARATWVLEKRQGAWRIVQTHVSAPIPADVLAREVFGEATPAAPPTPR